MCPRSQNIHILLLKAFFLSMADAYSFQYYPGCRENNIQIFHSLVTNSWTKTATAFSSCAGHVGWGASCTVFKCSVALNRVNQQLRRHVLSQTKWLLHSVSRKLRTWAPPRQVFIILHTWTEAPTFCFYCTSTTRILSWLSSKAPSSSSLQLRAPRKNCSLLELKWHKTISICRRL